LEILRYEGGAYESPGLTFVHPLVRAAVYDTLNPDERARMHQQAARLLTAADADAERVAAHLLQIPPFGDP
ncbi:hypothetical protein GTY86_04575, partial [Streptomyces sp. SID5770]|uniref:hypothetical protein n=1 Tax=Streptomyces sp. SID5770 TaxID=2690308 RepID=UPI00136BD919